MLNVKLAENHVDFCQISACHAVLRCKHLQMFYELAPSGMLGNSSKPRRARSVLELRRWKVRMPLAAAAELTCVLGREGLGYS